MFREKSTKISMNRYFHWKINNDFHYDHNIFFVHSIVEIWNTNVILNLSVIWKKLQNVWRLKRIKARERAMKYKIQNCTTYKLVECSSRKTCTPIPGKVKLNKSGSGRWRMAPSVESCTSVHIMFYRVSYHLSSLLNLKQQVIRYSLNHWPTSYDCIYKNETIQLFQQSHYAI